MNELTSRPLRWGIISAGKISHDFLVAMSTLNPLEHVPIAIAARRLEDAENFAKEHDIQKAYDSYDKLFCDHDVGELSTILHKIFPKNFSHKNCCKKTFDFYAS